ncbi:trypsin-like peptidase domain-containing protein [Microlunatus ginsengisoli]|uniref:PDZ domain-containing protein n=1 Tax=Microlunatus ginsengisoli TaxID=363863 RepID=A0ABP6ZU84_9ACTN
MAEDDSRSGGVGRDAGGAPDSADGPSAGRPDYHYYGSYDRGPYGAEQRPDPLGVGSWGVEEHTQPLPPARPTYAAPSAGGYSAPGGYPAPGGVPPLPPPTTVQAAGPSYPPPAASSTAPARRGIRPAAVIAIAALTALLIGGAAGYAGSRLGELTSPSTSTSTLAPAPSQPATPAGPAATPSARASKTPVAPAPDTLDAVAVAAKTLPSAVMIRVGSGQDSTIGSGFVLDDQGLVMTNNHVVAGAAEGQRLRVVFSDGTQAGASLVGRSPTYDIAVIRVKTSHALVPMPIGDSDDTKVGESVLAIGSPLGLPGTVTQGIVSARNRPVAVGSEGEASNAYINGTQTDAPINPGNSGGPLIDAGGRVIGVNSAILTLGGDRAQAGNIGLGFAIPINQAMVVGKMLIDDGKATYPVIGANVEDAGDLAGVRLSSVSGNGPAARAGMRVGDVVTKIDGQGVSATEELIVAVRSHRPGDRVTLTYRRDGQVREAQVTLGSREG